MLPHLSYGLLRLPRFEGNARFFLYLSLKLYRCLSLLSSTVSRADVLAPSLSGADSALWLPLDGGLSLPWRAHIPLMSERVTASSL